MHAGLLDHCAGSFPTRARSVDHDARSFPTRSRNAVHVARSFFARWTNLDHCDPLFLRSAGHVDGDAASLPTSRCSSTTRRSSLGLRFGMALESVTKTLLARADEEAESRDQGPAG